MAEAFGLQNPYFSVHEAICGDTTVVNGKQMLNFSSYNYVGNSGDPVVSKAAQDAIDKYGTSVSASRVASGEKPLTRELEKALADFFGTEDSIVLVSGHATNVTVIGHVVGAGRPHRARRAGARLHHPGREALGRQAPALPAQRLGSARPHADQPAAALPPGAHLHRGHLLDGRRHPRAAEVHRGEEEAQGAAAGRRGALRRRGGRHRPRRRRVLRRQPRRRRHVDGHAEQVLRLVRRLHRRQQGAGGVPQVHHARASSTRWASRPPNAAAALAATQQMHRAPGALEEGARTTPPTS